VAPAAGSSRLAGRLALGSGGLAAAQARPTPWPSAARAWGSGAADLGRAAAEIATPRHPAAALAAVYQAAL
jgi:hypothetical protein